MKKDNRKVGPTNLMANAGKATCFLAFFVICSPAVTFAQRGAQQREISGADAAKVIPGASSILEGINTTYPAFVSMKAEANLTPAGFAAWLKNVKKSPSSIDFKMVKQEKINDGVEFHRYVQTFQNLPVANAEYVVHIRGNRVTAFNGFAIDAPPDLSATPKLSEAAALKMAMKHIDAKQYKWESEFWENDIKQQTKNPKATYRPKGELLWTVGDNGKTLKLAYRFDISASNPDKMQRIFVDANQGEKIQILPLESNCSAASVVTVFDGSRSISTDKFTANDYRLRNNCQAAIFHVRDWGSATLTASPTEIQNTTNTWTTNNERFGGTVLWLTERAYDYFLTAHTRNSYDGGGGDVNGYINAKFDCSPPAGCVSDFNASMSFSGGTMKVGAGSGFADGYGTIDIIGHEYTHAVTGSSSGLVYANESGALNESFSDIFGEVIENFVFGSNNWLLGSQRSSGYIRNMSNPNDKGDPDTYNGTNWFTGSGDNGGVHTNSGVQNFWFYLLTVGGSGTNDISNAYNVSGIGLVKARNIAYANMISLSSGATYSSARTNSIAIARTLYGDCSNEVKQVINAWYAVGVGGQAFDATALVTSNYNGRDVSCNGVCDATVTVNVVGGTAPTYSWSPGGATTQTVNNRCAGAQTVTVTNHDAFTCSVVRTATVNATPLLVTAPAVTSNFNGYGVSCNGDNNGTASANASGGTSPYSYSWNTAPAKTTANITGLAAGNYMVTVTDANGCSKQGNITVTEPPLLTASAAPTTNYNGYNVRCNGGSDGAALAVGGGGVPPYSYSWNTTPVQTTAAATNLSAGSYTVTITDANGCSKTANTTLTEPPPLTIEAGPNQTRYYGYPDSNCANLTATGIGGGVPPYTIQWSTTQTTAGINVCPMTTTTYTVTLTDANNCTMSDNVTVCIIDVRCGKNLEKVTICHYTNDPLNPYQTNCVAMSAAKNHFISNHGDQLAACGIDKSCPPLGARGVAANYGGNTNAATSSMGTYLTAFPNPFSENTIIRFKLPADQHANIRLYDISGRMVMQLYDGAAKGNADTDVLFNAQNIAAGMYFVRLRTGDGEMIELKLILNK
jgi:Zn-dependent metalloprotease